MNYPSNYKGINSIDSFKKVYYKGYEKMSMKHKLIIVVEANDFDLSLDERDELYASYEATNDSYHRFYSINRHIMDNSLHKKIIKQLKKNNIIDNTFYNSKYNNILIHFDW